MTEETKDYRAKFDDQTLRKFIGEFASQGLLNLRRVIDDPDSGVTWKNPHAEVRYPEKSWDWDRGGFPLYDEDNPDERPVKSNLLPDDILKITSRLFLYGVAFRPVAARIKPDGMMEFFFLDDMVKDEVEALPTQEERDARIRELAQPLTIGGREIIVEEGIPLKVSRVPVLKDISGVFPQWVKDIDTKLRDLPELNFTGEVLGVPYSGVVSITFFPLEIYEQKREAYFPVVTSINFGLIEPVPEHWSDISEWAKGTLAEGPSTWPKKAVEDLWKTLLVDLPKRLQKAEEKPKRISASVQCFTSKEPEEKTAELKTRTGETLQAVQDSAGMFCPPEMPALSEALVPVPVGGPPSERRTAGVAFGPTPYSAQALAIVKEIHRIHFPKRWGNLKTWAALQDEEIRSVLDNEGDRAFKNLKRETGDRDARGPLLERRTQAGKEVVVLTKEAQLRLRQRAGFGRGYVDVDKYGRETHFHFLEFEKDKGFLEVGFSWFGVVAPLVDEWRKEQKQAAEKVKEDLNKNPLLFDELTEKRKKKVDQLLSRITLYEDGRRMMEAILGQVTKQGRNPVEIPAEAFRVLLWPDRARKGDWPPNWKQRIEDALKALNALTFNVRTYKMDHLKAYGSMVAEWSYKDFGRGGHKDGVYIINITSGFLGCLAIYEAGKTRLRSGQEAIRLLIGEPTEEAREFLGWKKGKKAVDWGQEADAGEPFYTKAAGLSPTQENLSLFISKNITRRWATVRKGNPARKVKKSNKDARPNDPRTYTSAFCPLLPEGKNYYAALGNFPKNPELGFYLGGAESHASRHPGGLLYHMGYKYPTGSARAKRAKVISQALDDLSAVVEKYLHGIVAAYDRVKWITFEDARKITDPKTAAYRIRYYFFLPEDYEEKRRQDWTETTGRRVTENPMEAEAEVWEDQAGAVPVTETPSEKNAFRGWPLYQRLRGMMELRGLRQKDLASIFQVTPPIITRWLKGTEAPQSGDGLGSPIPEDLAPLVLRWVETEKTPSAEDMASIMARRQKKKGGGGRPTGRN